MLCACLAPTAATGSKHAAIFLKGEDVSTDTGQSTWTFSDSSGGSCPPERSSTETSCLEAVQAAATEAGLGEVFRFKVVDDAYIPPGCSYSTVSQAALFNRNGRGESDDWHEEHYKPVCESKGKSKLPVGLSRVSGVATRRATPLFEQDKPWEPRVDNGYPNVVPPDASAASHLQRAWQLWYGDCVDDLCLYQILLYANSTDGLSWQKPELGIFDVGSVRPDLRAIGKKNNIVLEGGGIGVYKDPAERDETKRYKAFGPGCYSQDVKCHLNWGERSDSGALQRGGSFGAALQERETPAVFDPQKMPQRLGRWRVSDDLAYSEDGLHWHGAGTVDWPSPHRYDCHNNLVYDAKADEYIATTRIGFNVGPGREVGLARSEKGRLAFDTSKPPSTSKLGGSSQHQLYSQITFPWLDVWLGIVMVYDAQNKAGRVNCRLAWAPSALGQWQWVEDRGLTGTEIIPLGPDGSFDSHVCFAAAAPVAWHGEERLYYFGGDGPHSGERKSSFGLATLRPDGYAALRGSGSFLTTPLRVTGSTLTATVDFHDEAGSLKIGLSSKSAELHAVPAGLRASASLPLKANSTDAKMAFEGGADFSSLRGLEVVLEVRMQSASLFTVGFA